MGQPIRLLDTNGQIHLTKKSFKFFVVSLLYTSLSTRDYYQAHYTVLADPKHSAYNAIKTGSDTIAIAVDNRGIVHWSERWPDYQDEPDYEIVLQALRDVRYAEEARG